ncbi:MAG: SMC-Scp complex subunit ScpB [Gammaproteobacteria bacterium]
MDENNLIPLLEAAIFSSFTPLTPEALQRLFEEGERPALGEIRQALKSLQTLYADRAIELKEVASGFRFQVREEWALFIGRMHEIKPQRYSRALMETLALIAYRQPITRAEIEDIRGVVVSSQIIKTLLDHNWIRVVGYKEVPGRPGLYATTKNFLDHFNLKSLEDLPPLPDIKTFEKEMTPQPLNLEEAALPDIIENQIETDLDDESDKASQPIQDVEPDVEVESDEIKANQNPEVII